MTIARTKGMLVRVFRPAADLSQDTAADLSREPDHIAGVDVLTALGVVREPAGAAVLHARIGGEQANAVKVMLLEWCTIAFEQRGWKAATRRHTADEMMALFVNQVWAEFSGPACRKCSGRGSVGQKFDAVRHGLVKCKACRGAGYVVSVGSKRGKKSAALTSATAVHRQCSVCRGNRYVPLTEMERATKLRSCTACDGTGRHRPSQRARGQALEVSAPIIGKVWAERFYVALRELRRIERRTLHDVNNYLFSD